MKNFAVVFFAEFLESTYIEVIHTLIKFQKIGGAEMRRCYGHLNAAPKVSNNFPYLMLLDKRIHEPEFLGDAFSVLAKSEGQAEKLSPRNSGSGILLSKSIKRGKLLENQGCI